MLVKRINIISGNVRPPQGGMMQTSLHVIANEAIKDKAKRFCSLYSLFNRVLLEKAYQKLNKDAATGIDEVTWEDYGRNLPRNLIELEERLKQKRYWPRYTKRVLIPKPNGKKRPLGISILEDKIVQQLAADILNALYEPLFLPCSYAYRPDRSAKQAVQALREELDKKYVWVVEADIKGFFDHLDHDWLLKMIQTRVNDKALTELIRRFLKSGILCSDNTTIFPEEGSPQGSIISPVLANIYLHYVLDQWFEKEFKCKRTEGVFMIRYADDFVAAFRFHTDAARFRKELDLRLNKFNLETAEDKTRKLMFNRLDKDRSKTFTFLGFEFRRSLSAKGKKDVVRTLMARKKLKKAVDEFRIWCKKFRNRRIAWIMGHVKSKIQGVINYFSLPGNVHRHKELVTLFQRALFYWLNRRSERKSYSWKTFYCMWDHFFEGKKKEKLRNEGIQLSFVKMLL
jgi:group II intron reverse transcriptase/maturase